MPGPTVAIALQPEPVAVVLDFVDPFRAVRDGLAPLGMQGSTGI